ncbi:hypothetical protein F9Y90_04475 (plasmid) [Borrelia miyamotoi]|nr:hypothetical protein [Borrelia miyamotoi]QFP42369.1 hypothetical protein F9Y90_04475 [Borrelia miyamotoi]QFP48490.1 hypothetical protein F9Y91_04460 [Borrelia miyamotoi]
MRKFYIVFCVFSMFLSLSMLACNKSLEEREDSYTSESLSLADEAKQIKNNLASGMNKGLVVVPCVEDTFIAHLEELSESEKMEKEKAYSELVKVVTNYKAQLADELQVFEAAVEATNKELEEAEVEDITDDENNTKDQIDVKEIILEPLAKTHFHEVSQEFKDQDLINTIYASLGYDVKVINKLEKIIASLDLDVALQVNNELDKQLHDELLNLSYNMLFCLSYITNSAMLVVNDYLDEMRLSNLEKVSFTQKIVDLHNHIEEFIQNRAQFIEKIKDVILNIKIGNKQSMLSVLRDIMDDKGEIVSASNFTQRKSSLIQCEVNNLLKIL